MTEAIVALPRGELQSQLLLLRLCAGPQPNYWLRALPLVWGARLAASVDRAAQGGVRRLLTDARDAPAVVDARLARAALLLSHGGLGIGGRTAIVPAAALASRVDALRAGRPYSRALAAVADFLIAADGVAPTGGTPAPPPSAGVRVTRGRILSPPVDRAPTRLPGAAPTAPALEASSGSAPGGVEVTVVAGGHPVAMATPLAAGGVGDSLVVSPPVAAQSRTADVRNTFCSLASATAPPPPPPVHPTSPHLLPGRGSSAAAAAARP